MSEYVQVVLIGNVFRVFCLLGGLGFGYLGYRLYVIGVFEKAQELKAAFGKAHLHAKAGCAWGRLWHRGNCYRSFGCGASGDS